MPPDLKKQLASGGKLVIPIGNEIWRIEKISEEDFKIDKFPGFIFVPFVVDQK